MGYFDLVCRDCEHKFEVVTRGAIKERQKRCPECGSANVRQTFGSFLRNGALSDPQCGAPQRSSGYG
jgi:putative FmdB family regulatory protein